MKMEWDAEAVDDYGGIPEPGDFIKFNGEEKMVVRSYVVNNSKVEMQLEPKRETKHYNDACDASESWEEINEKYLNNSSTSFLDSGLSP